MRTKRILLRLGLAMLVFLTIACASLEMSLVDSQTDEPVQGQAPAGPPRTPQDAARTETAPSEASRPADTAVPVPTQAASVQIHAEPRTTLGYPGWHIAWAPDGRLLFIGERQLHVLDARSLNETRSLLYDDGISGIAISPDGRVLAVIVHGVVLIDAASGSELRTLPGSEISTSAASNSFLTFTPDSATLAVVIGDVVKLFDVASGEETGTVVAKGAFAIAISPDGKTLYAGGWGKGITVWDIDSGSQVRSIGDEWSVVNTMVLSPDGSQLASAGVFTDPIILWDTATGRQLHAYAGHTATINSLAFSPDGLVLASASDDVTIKLWDVATGALLQTLVGHTEAITSLAFSPDGTTLASGTMEEGDLAVVRLWTISSGPAQPTATSSAAAVDRPTPIPLSARAILPENASAVQRLSALEVSASGSLAWSPDGKWLVDAGQTLHFLDGETYQEVRSAHREMDGLAVSPDGRILAAVGNAGVVLFDLADGEERTTLERTNADTSATSNNYLAFTPDSAKLAVVVRDVVKVFDVVSGAETGTIPAKGAFAIAVSPDGRTLYAGGWGEEITIWDIASGTLVRSFGAESRGVNCMALSPDGSLLASGGVSTDLVILWDAATGRRVRTFAGHTDDVTSLTFSPDGRMLATSSSDVTIKLWDTATGAMLNSLVGHSRSPESIVFSPDGATLASSSHDDGIYLWAQPEG